MLMANSTTILTNVPLTKDSHSASTRSRALQDQFIGLVTARCWRIIDLGATIFWVKHAPVDLFGRPISLSQAQ